MNTLSVANDVVKFVHPRVLIVLELDETADKVSAAFCSAGYNVVLCKTFSAASKMVDTKNISLIVADVHPENGGSVFDFLRYVKEDSVTQVIPVILFSLRPTRLANYLEDGVRTTARLLGCDMYLAMENFEEAVFLKTIDSLLPPTHESTADHGKESKEGKEGKEGTK